MIRRRRTAKESPYSPDSFLDIICNLVYKYVGIVLIVLVLVAKQASLWPNLNSLRVGPMPSDDPEAVESSLAGSASDGPIPDNPPSLARPANAMPKLEPLPDKPDPEAQAFEREIAQLRARLLEQLRTMEVGKAEASRVRQRQAAMAEEAAAVRRQKNTVDEQLASIQHAADETQAEAKPLRQRIDELQKALKSLEAVPPERRALRYHPPISKPVNAGELFFECRDNRVAFIDLQELLDQVRNGLGDKVNVLRNQWELIDQAGPVGPFALKYKVSRQRADRLDTVFGSTPPTERGFSYGVTEWEVIPVQRERGEPVTAALAASSGFRRIVDSLDTDQAVLTFFVYDDSFPAFRTLREYLSERGFLVAGRPLPMDVPIGGSPKGTKSRAQ